ncbi:hypothetical protein KAT92_06280 [Candidatus Babeliales bacterium]|nr:hypothetical protein [Candidatus Babeliales bacterium]
MKRLQTEALKSAVTSNEKLIQDAINNIALWMEVKDRAIATNESINRVIEGLEDHGN